MTSSNNHHPLVCRAGRRIWSFTADQILATLSFVSAVQFICNITKYKHSLLKLRSFHTCVLPLLCVGIISPARAPCCAASACRWSSPWRAPRSTPRCRWWSLWEEPSPAPSSRTPPRPTPDDYRKTCPRYWAFVCTRHQETRSRPRPNNGDEEDVKTKQKSTKFQCR